MRRIIAFILGYGYYLHKDGQTVRRVKDNYGFSTVTEFAGELGYRDKLTDFWPWVYSQNLLFHF